MSNAKLLQLDKELFEVKEFWRIVTSPYIHDRLEDSEVIKILADERVIGTIRKYGGKAAKRVVAGWLVHAAYYLRNRNTVVEISKILADERVIGTIRKYDDEAAEEAFFLVG
jgi:hypothetical protein